MADNNTPPAPSDQRSFIKALLDRIFGEDPSLGLAITVGLIVIFTALAALNSGAALSDLNDTVKTIGIGLAIAAVAVIVFRVINKGPLGTLIVWVMTLGALVITAIFAVQFATGDRFTPPLARAGCYVAPASKGCPLSSEYSMAQVSDAPTESLAPETTTTGASDDPTLQPIIMPDPNPPRSDGRIFVQFAGAIDRSEVISAATSTAELGWDFQRPDRGGERIGTAAGLNEVRFFHAEDHDAAFTLANEFAASASWVSVEDFSLRDMSQSGYKVPQGQMEIWTSLN